MTAPPARDLLDRHAEHEMHPPDLRPLLHLDHRPPPDSTNKPGSTPTRTPRATAPGGENSTGTRGWVFRRRRQSAARRADVTLHTEQRYEPIWNQWRGSSKRSRRSSVVLSRWVGSKPSKIDRIAAKAARLTRPGSQKSALALSTWRIWSSSRRMDCPVATTDAKVAVSPHVLPCALAFRYSMCR